MDARTVIESYVHDVTQLLSRKDRADVALELRALLAEELAARAAGAPADEAMAIELVRGFGAPARSPPATGQRRRCWMLPTPARSSWRRSWVRW